MKTWAGYRDGLRERTVTYSIYIYIVCVCVCSVGETKRMPSNRRAKKIIKKTMQQKLKKLTNVSGEKKQ